MKIKWRVWAYNLLADSIRGGANAVTASSVVALGDTTQQYNIYGRKFYILMGSVFLAHAVINLSHYLETKPLPEIAPEDQTPASRASESSSKA